MPVYLVDASNQPRPVRIEAGDLLAVAGFVHEKGWLVRSIQYLSEVGESDLKADVKIRQDYRPKSLATKIELTVGQLVVGIVLTVAFLIFMTMLLSIGLSL